MTAEIVDTLQSLLYAFTSEGLTGLVLLVLLLCLLVMAFMFYVYHRTRVMELVNNLAEFKQDRDYLAQLIENNTVAMTRTSAIIQHCALIVENNQRLLQRVLERHRVRRYY